MNCPLKKKYNYGLVVLWSVNCSYFLRGTTLTSPSLIGDGFPNWFWSPTLMTRTVFDDGVSFSISAFSALALELSTFS